MLAFIDWIVVTGLITGSLVTLAASVLLLLTYCRRTPSKLQAPSDCAGRKKPTAPYPPPNPRWFPFLLVGSGVGVVFEGPALFQISHSLSGGTDVMNAIVAAMMISGGLMILTALRLIVLGRRNTKPAPSGGG